MSELDTQTTTAEQTSSHPPVPPGDTLFSKADGVFYSYGPRVAIDEDDQCDVGPPAEGQEPQFYGVYMYGPAGTMPDGASSFGWGWVVDLPSVEAVQEFLKTA